MFKKSLFLLLFQGIVFFTYANTVSVSSDTIGPRVFLLGEDEDKMAMLNKNYPTLLMTVFNNDMDVAYDKWMLMLSDMEVMAEKLNVDIKGVKMWMNVYWNKNGKIDYIAYYLKPNSKNIRLEELNAFFINFIKNYQMKVSASRPFYHNGSVAFPTHYKFMKSQEEKTTKN